MSRSDASDYIKELMGKESGTWESETLAEIEGPTAEATEGGLHSPSSFAMTWENEVGTSISFYATKRNRLGGRCKGK